MSGDLNHAVSEIIARLLVQLEVAADPEGELQWACYDGTMPDVPDDCICVSDTDGRMEGRFQTNGQMQEKYGIQIAVRSGSPVHGYKKATKIKQKVDTEVRLTQLIIDEDVYLVHAITRTSQVIKMGQEPTGSRRHRWSINAIVSLTASQLGTGSP